MKKRFLLPLSLLFITIFGLVGCSNFLSLKTKVTMNFNGQELYRAVKARSADDFIIDSAELEVKLFVDDKEFSKQTITITEKSSKNLSVKFSDIKLDSVVYAEAKITIKNPDNKPETVLYGKSDSKTLTDYFVEISIVLKWADDDSKYDPANTPIIPDGQPDSFTLKYNIYKYEQKTDVDNPANYELYKSYTFTVNYKDFKNFSDFTCVDLIIKTTEMSFDMCLAGYEENYTLEDGDEPQIINGEATLNSYWYKTGTPITPTILVQKADIAKYQLKLYNGDDKIYIIEDDNGNRLAMGSWMINMTSIEPEKYGIYLGQALTYNDGIPKLSFDIGNTQPYTPELNDISTDGLTIKNLIGDTETTITFETSGLDVQALMSGTSPVKPLNDSIEITVNCDDEIYAVGSQITVSAKNTKTNTDIPAGDIIPEISVDFIMNGSTVASYMLYPTLDDGLAQSLGNTQLFTIQATGNNLVITTALPDNFAMSDPNQYTRFDFKFTATDESGYNVKPISKIIKEGQKTDIKLTIDGTDEIYAKGSQITVTAKNTKTNTDIPVSSITPHIFYEIYYYNSKEFKYVPSGDVVELYPTLNQDLIDQFSGVQFFTDISTENSLILQTNFPDDFIAQNSEHMSFEPKQMFTFGFSATDSSGSATQSITKEIIPGPKPEVTVTMYPNEEEIPKNQTVIFTATDKNGPVTADKITVEVGTETWNSNDGFVFTAYDSSWYTVTLNSVNNSQELEFNDGMPVATPFMIKVSVINSNSETEISSFTTKLSRVLVQKTVTIDATDSKNTIIQNITEAFEDCDFPNCQLELAFEGSNDSDDINLYGIIKTILNDESIPYSGLGRILSLDYSGVTGEIVARIPNPETPEEGQPEIGVFEDMDILKAIVLSPSTLSIGKYAFYSNTNNIVLDDLSLENVTDIGVKAFYNTTIDGDFDLPKVTDFGNMACSQLKAETVTLGKAEELYNESAYDSWGLSVFEGAKIDTLVANKLKRICSMAFYNAEIGDFAIPDTIIYIGYRSLYVTSNSHVYFASANGDENWYRFNDGGFMLGNQLTSFDEIAEAVYTGIYDIATIKEILKQDNNATYQDRFEDIDPEDVIDCICSNDIADYIKDINP